MVLLFAKRAFASKVAIFVSSPDKHALPNIMSAVNPSSLVDIQGKEQFTHWITAHSSVGRTLFPQFVAKLSNSLAMVSDVIKIENERTFRRPIYAGNAVETVEVLEGVPVALTIRPTAFPPSRDGNGSIKSTLVDTTDPKVTFVSLEGSDSSRPDLASAQIVVSGGRALKTREQFDAILVSLADALGPSITAIGASRAAVDSNLAPNDLQVGQTGRVVAPQLYIAIGISGAIQHVAGMKDSKCVVAINRDADAPIVKVADYSLIGDLFEIVPELVKAIKEAKQQ